MYLNKAIIVGNLTRDPELRSLPTGIKVCSMGVATNRVWKNKDGAKQESTDYHNIVVFGRQAELCAQYLRKGRSLMVEGRMQTRSWEADGQKKYRTEIVADRVQFGPGGSAGSTPAGEVKEEKDTKDQGDAPVEYPTEEINPDDIPF